MKIDDTIDIATMVSLCVCVFGWIMILLTVPLFFVNSGLANIFALSGLTLMVIGAGMTLMIEPIFRLVYKYLSKKD